MKKHILPLLFQFISVFFASLISFLLRPVSILFSIMIYAVIPLFSSYFSLRTVLKGINPYLAWILPPVAQTLAGFLITLGIGPDPLPIMITAFVALVGAAAGDVLNKTNKKGKT